MRNNRINYPEDYVSAICYMYKNNEPYNSIRENLRLMYPNIRPPRIDAIREIATMLMGQRVLSTAGGNLKLYSLLLCEEVSNFLESLPLATDKSSVVNGILLNAVRQYNLRRSKLKSEREARLRELTELTAEFGDTHTLEFQG